MAPGSVLQVGFSGSERLKRTCVRGVGLGSPPCRGLGGPALGQEEPVVTPRTDPQTPGSSAAPTAVLRRPPGPLTRLPASPSASHPRNACPPLCTAGPPPSHGLCRRERRRDTCSWINTCVSGAGACSCLNSLRVVFWGGVESLWRSGAFHTAGSLRCLGTRSWPEDLVLPAELVAAGGGGRRAKRVLKCSAVLR